MPTRPYPIALVLALALFAGFAFTAPATAEEPADEMPAEVADVEPPPITVYMTSWCPYCRKAQKLLDEIGADYVSKDIEKDPEALREFQRKGSGGSGVPLIDFDGKTLRGFNADKIRKLANEVAADNG